MGWNHQLVVYVPNIYIHSNVPWSLAYKSIQHGFQQKHEPQLDPKLMAALRCAAEKGDINELQKRLEATGGWRVHGQSTYPHVRYPHDK